MSTRVGTNHTNATCREASERIFAKHIQHLGKGLSFYLDTYSDFAEYQHRAYALRVLACTRVGVPACACVPVHAQLARLYGMCASLRSHNSCN